MELIEKLRKQLSEEYGIHSDQELMDAIAQQKPIDIGVFVKEVNGIERVDMMGYVVRRRYTIIRGRVFRRIRRQVLRAWEDFKTKGFIPWWRACRIAAYKGWVKHSNSLKFRIKYCFDKLFKMCSYSASKHGKEVENEKRILLITALSD